MYIYDYVKVDKIMQSLQIDPNQFHLLYLLFHRKEGQSTNAQIERFKEEVLQYMTKDAFRHRIMDLIEKGLLEDFNPISREGSSTYRYYDVDNFLVTSRFADKVFIATEEAGEEFWSSYPARFPIGNSWFLARSGDKDRIVKLYARKIKNDIAMHQFAIAMLDKYREMVKNGSINAHKISDFVEGEMWYTIAEIVKEESANEFGKDI